MACAHVVGACSVGACRGCVLSGCMPYAQQRGTHCDSLTRARAHVVGACSVGACRHAQQRVTPEARVVRLEARVVRLQHAIAPARRAENAKESVRGLRQSENRD